MWLQLPWRAEEGRAGAAASGRAGGTTGGSHRGHGGTPGRAVGWARVSPLGAERQLGRAGSLLPATAMPRVLLWSDAPRCPGPVLTTSVAPALPELVPRLAGADCAPASGPGQGTVCLSVRPALLRAVLPAPCSRPRSGVSSQPVVLPQEGRISALARCFLAPQIGCGGTS